MLPSNGLGDVDKECFTADAQYAFQHTGLNTTDIKEYIRNPHKFNIKLAMDGRYYNLWSTDNDRLDANDEEVVKSVYDPSPVGYTVPASNAFTGVTSTGNIVGDWSEGYILTPEEKAKLNVAGDFDKGYYFYTKPVKEGGTFWYPVSGYPHYTSGTLVEVLFGGYWWLPLLSLKIAILVVVNQLLANSCLVIQNQRGTKLRKNKVKNTLSEISFVEYL